MVNIGAPYLKILLKLSKREYFLNRNAAYNENKGP